ncbi:MAG TPA: hypothetical protein VGP63_26160 [Planctomycetaceae bacterium]|jgi:hypothetical protein|nr:hypothetical protein [Planctomycetaceae bacterium]
MAMRFIYLVATLSCGPLLGCSDAPTESVTLYSLIENERPGHNMKEAFHDCLILGKTDVASASDRLAVIDALQKGHLESDGTKYDCFIPRHGLRVRRNGTTTDYVISFDCLQMKKYFPNRRETMSITASAKRVLDEYLKKAGIPQAEPPH